MPESLPKTPKGLAEYLVRTYGYQQALTDATFQRENPHFPQLKSHWVRVIKFIERMEHHA
jgi:hypothetical protein